MRCCCCGISYAPLEGRKPDPNRDRGFGYCEGCRPDTVEDWVRHEGMTREAAEALLATLA